ncbi:MAG TPA: hypothetical protein VM531_06885 [Sphingomicrobium sp.]|nr:hypothetical protein [Sphingomicrobium sp.]
MARVKFQKAAKDYPAQGIKKGDKYYYARVKTGPRSSKEIRSLKPIPRSQLTTSAFLQQFYNLEDQFQTLRSTPLAELEGALDSLASEVRDLAEEEQSKFDNMESEAPGLAQGPTGELIQERAQAMEEWAGSLESMSQEVQEKLDEFTANQALWDEWEASEDEDKEEPEEDQLVECDVVADLLDEVAEPSVG